MFKILISIVILHQVYCEQTALDVKKTFNYDVYNYDRVITVTVNNRTEQILDFKEADPRWEGYPTRVHVSTNDSLSPDYPIFITATQQKGVSSWELPLLVQTHDRLLTFKDMARTLCPHDAGPAPAPAPAPAIGPDILSITPPTVHVSTESPADTTVRIKVRRVTDFYIQLDKEVSLAVTPGTPKYYYFSFDQNPLNATDYRYKGFPILNYTVPENVVLIIESSDDLCATVSIQNNSCPVFDNEQDVTFQGYHLTMMSKGGITVTRAMFPHGIYVVFLLKESDAECTGASETAAPLAVLPLAAGDRTKRFTFRVVPSVSYAEYLLAAMVVIAVVTLVAAFVIAANFLRQELPSEPAPLPSTSRDSEQAINDTEEQWSSTQALTVARLTQVPADTLARRSNRYFWGALTVAVVYSLPVVQLLYTYQKMALTTGDQDVCYYNFLCAHSLWGMSDFNHVFSNLPYLLLGAVFIGQVWARQRRITCKEGMGIPQHYGLLYSMGLALIMEGSLSACYHLCPNKMNFQFDSSFMYVIAVLVMIKLYQNRHPDLVPSAHSTFMVLAVIMSIGVVGVLFPSTYFSVLFTALHLATCFLLTLKIYYAGTFHIRNTVSHVWAACRGGRRGLVPTHRARALLLALANLANWTFAIYCEVVHIRDVARQILVILMGNAILYTIFYIAMKLVHRETMPAHAALYILLSHAAWFTALYFFTHGNTKWSQTPAMSRAHNGLCTALHVFDAHDLWHVSSAAALFLSFNVLLAVDDDAALAATPRHRIVTF